MIIQIACLLASAHLVAGTGQGNGRGNGQGNGRGNGQGNGQGNGRGNGGGSSNNNNNGNNGRIPLTESFIRSFDGSEDRRAGLEAELIRISGPAHYPDGKGIDLNMFTLPNARGISNMVADPSTLSTPPGKSRASDMMWQWGQLMDHDIGLTEGHDEAFTIVSPTCMAPAPNTDLICDIPFRRAIHHFTNGVREQLNEITAFLDASMVYGHTQERADFLREFSGGRMKMTSEGLLPDGFGSGLANALPGGLGFMERDLFIGGDVRVNEQLGLLAIHTLWVREHNRVAAILRQNFARSTDEQLYQMARKIITAEIQAITYKEFLPVMIGTSFAPSLEDYNGFQPSVNPAVSAEFTTVAFRVGHTFLSGSLLLHNATAPTGRLSLINAFFDPGLAREHPNLIDEVLIGQTIQPANAADTKIIPEVRTFLFGAPVAGQGRDLVAFNIQRGRDHGVLKYNNMREGLGLSRKTSFGQITSNAEIAAELSAAYGGNIELCDPWICGIAEDAVTPGDGELGELFSTIIADQFQRLMDGDVFFYLNDPDVRHPQILRAGINVDSITLQDVLNLNTVGGVGPDAMLA